jgi:hypothetical protein
MLNDCLEDAEKLLERGTESLSIKDCASNLINLVADHGAFLGGLLDLDEEDQKSSKVLKTNFKKLAAISKCLQPLLETGAFSLSRSENLQKAIRDTGEELRKAQMRINTAMVSQARVMMSTIGSSHKLPVDDHPDGLGVIFSEMRLSDDKTIVIFDEAGCIPAYELLGLSRLGRQIDALVAVGDEHQLPPYSPNENSFRKNASRSRCATPQRAGAKVKSILDVSRCRIEDETKIKLTTQYRVPRDIANILNARIYKGDYNTSDGCNVPHRGFCFVNVDSYQQRDEKYVNRAEVEQCLDLVVQLVRANDGGSIMLLTPVSISSRRNMDFMLIAASLNVIICRMLIIVFLIVQEATARDAV